MFTDPDLIWYAIKPFLGRRVMAYGEKSAPAEWLQPRLGVIKSYLHTGTKTTTSFMVVDVDDVADAGLAWNRAGLPPPHFVVMRWDSGSSAHLIWALRVPVSRDSNKSAAKYLDDIRRAYTQACCGDLAYSNQRMKSPLSEDWHAWMPGGAPAEGYELSGLHGCVDLAQAPKARPQEMTWRAEGRNCTLFGASMKEAARQACRMGAELHGYILDFCHEQNSLFPDPLCPNEVKTVAKSAAHRALRDHPEHHERFIRRQAWKSGKGNAVKQMKATDRWSGAAAMRAAGLTCAEIGAAMELSAEAVKKGLQRHACRANSKGTLP